MKQLIITPEEMAEIRRRFEILRRGHPITGSFSLGVHIDGYLRNYAHCFEVNFISLLNTIEQAEANVARLNKELDWLAMHLSGYDAQKKCTVYAADWKEAARRAVAAGEG